MGVKQSYDQEICGFIDRNREAGTTAGEYALPAVQSKLRELRRRLAQLALCHSVQITVSYSGWPFRAPMQEVPDELIYRDLPA